HRIIASPILIGSRSPSVQPALQFLFRDQEIKPSAFDIQTDRIAILDNSQGASDGRFGCNVKDDGPETGPAHARIADSYHVFDAALEKLGRDWDLTPLRHARS